MLFFTLGEVFQAHFQKPSVCKVTPYVSQNSLSTSLENFILEEDVDINPCLIMQQSFFAICSPVETTIVPPGGCKYNGKIYPLGTYIYKHECGFVKCAEGGHILVGDKGCAIPYNDEIATLPPQPNTCKYNGKKYKDGEFIYKHKCGFLKCGSGGMLIAGDYNCAFPTRSRKTTPTPIPTKPKGCYHNRSSSSQENISTSISVVRQYAIKTEIFSSQIMIAALKDRRLNQTFFQVFFLIRFEKHRQKYWENF